MHRHSIFFKLNILFVVALAVTLIAGASIMMHLVKKEHTDMRFKSRLIRQEYRATKQKPVSLFQEFGLVEVQGKEKQEVLKNAGANGHKKHRKRSKILFYQGNQYLYITKSKYTILLKDNRSELERYVLPLLVFLGIIVLLTVMYILLRKSLTPLKHLQRDIVDYGEGKLKNYSFSKKRDEISQAANAFYHSVEKVNRLSASRQLFVRNLFHELNTPVTKGKILAEIVEDPKTQSMLESIFGRLSSLLKELAQMEKITSENYTLHKKNVRIIDLIDEASDLLFLETAVKSHVNGETITADFAAMSIVFKNLIDNALKYGTDLEIFYRPEALLFVSRGEPLTEKLSYYTEAFSKGQEQQSSKGFGLGLYIVNEILYKHGMGFEYQYKENKNYFIITLQNNL